MVQYTPDLPTELTRTPHSAPLVPRPPRLPASSVKVYIRNTQSRPIYIQYSVGVASSTIYTVSKRMYTVRYIKLKLLRQQMADMYCVVCIHC